MVKYNRSATHLACDVYPTCAVGMTSYSDEYVKARAAAAMGTTPVAVPQSSVARGSSNSSRNSPRRSPMSSATHSRASPARSLSRQGQFIEPLLSSSQHSHAQLFLNGTTGTGSGSGGGMMYEEVMPHQQPFIYDSDMGATPTGYGYIPPFSVVAEQLAHSDSIILNNNGDDSCIFAVSPVRWWVLSVFCYLAFMQSFIWVTYSPISKKAEEYYSITEGQVDLLLNWGPIFAIPVLPFVAAFASTSRGMQRLIYATAWLELVAVSLHLLPELGGKNNVLHPYALYFLHPAHILNSVAGSIVGATVTKMSCLWFAPEERTFSTALLFISNQVGNSAGFLLGPALVKTAGDMPHYLLVQFVCVALGFLCVFPIFPRFYFPARPRDFFPSKAAQEMENEGLGGSTDSLTGQHIAPATFRDNLRAVGQNRSFLLLALSSGLLTGLFATWTSVLSNVLVDFSDTTVGWMSFAATWAGAVGGVLVGPIAARENLRRKLKSMIVICFIASTGFAAAFLMLTPSIFSSSPLIPGSSVPLMFIFLSLLGAFVGASSPLCFELSVELLYPRWESITAGVITFINNAAGVIFLGVAPVVAGKTMTAAMFGTMIVATCLLMGVKEKYVRMDHELDVQNNTRRRNNNVDEEELSTATSINDMEWTDDFAPVQVE